MQHNLYLRLINRILLPGIDVNSPDFRSYTAALSPVTPLHRNIESDLSIHIKRLGETVKTGFIVRTGDSLFREKVYSKIRECVKITEFLLKCLTGKEIVNVSASGGEEFIKETSYEYLLILYDNSEEKEIRVIIESRFFNLFHPPLESSIQYNDIMKMINPYFERKIIPAPEVETLFSALSGKKLSDLINHLLRTERLSPFEIYSVMLRYPHIENKIRNALSDNLRKDIEFIKKKYSSGAKINRRDTAAADYSVREAVSDLLLKERTPYSPELYDTADILKKIHRYSRFNKTSFQDKIEEIEKRGLVNSTLALTDDETIRKAFYGDEERGRVFLKKYIPEKRVKEILESDIRITFNRKKEAEIDFISQYRKALSSKIKPDHESLSFLIASVKYREDFSLIVFETGWFMISTALKGEGEKIRRMVIDNVESGAALLIEGVLKGTLNPDLIHDEKGIKRAAQACVKKILLLYNESLIELET